ncbi:MAG: hypothetical protein OEW84_02805 [Aigarchaeota archaeon]|nr:hypothetical protein [Aigarchaeota archaeon]
MEKKMIKILQVLDRASCFCPLGYVSLHTNIVEPLKILEALEEKGYVRRCECDDSKSVQISPSYYPMFEISPRGRQELRQMETNVLQIPLSVVAEKFR